MALRDKELLAEIVQSDDAPRKHPTIDLVTNDAEVAPCGRTWLTVNVLCISGDGEPTCGLVLGDWRAGRTRWKGGKFGAGGKGKEQRVGTVRSR